MNDPPPESPAARHARKSHLFAQARRLEEPARSIFLRRECGDDEALRSDVEALLGRAVSDRRLEPDELSARILGRASEVLAPATPLPKTIGAHRIVRLVGEGGMGVVYEAEQDNPRRRVALKVLRAGLATPQHVRRFEREIGLLARLKHPGIATVLAAGVDESAGGAQRWFSMEFVDGEPLTHVARREGVTARDKLELLARTCEAVAHAHAQGIVHRDLKPANILVDAQGAPQVLDFGVAVLTEGDDMTRGTRTGDLVGTLAYMSPEQASGRASSVDARSDVHALGVIGFEMLSGRLPFAVDDVLLPEIARRITQEVPPSLGSIDPVLRGAPSTILARALEKEPARRYADAGEMAADLRRHLEGDAILARPVAQSEQIVRMARRHGALLAGAGATIVALAIGLVIAVRQAVIAGCARAQAVEAQQSERAAADEARAEAYCSRLAAAAGALANDDVAAARADLDRAPEHLRGWEWHALASQLDQSVREFASDAGMSQGASWSPDGARIVALVFRRDGTRALTWVDVADGTRGSVDAPPEARPLPDLPGASHYLVRFRAGERAIPVLDAATGQPLPDLVRPGPWDEAEEIRAETPDGRFRVVMRGAQECAEDVVSSRTMSCWDRGTGVFGEAVGVALDPRGRFAISGACRPPLLVRELATGRLLARLEGHVDQCQWSCAFAPDGSRFTTTAQDALVFSWDSRTFERLAERHGPKRTAASSAAWSLDGRLLALPGRDGCVRVVDKDLADVAALHGHVSWAQSPVFSPDGRWLATRGENDGTRLWDVGAISKLGPLQGHASYVYGVAALADGRRIASASWDGTIRVWDSRTHEQLLEARPPAGIEPRDRIQVAVAGTPDGSRVATLSNDGSVALIDVETGRVHGQRHLVNIADGGVLAFDPNGSVLAVAVSSGLALLDGATLDPRCSVPDAAAAVAWLGHGRLAGGLSDGRVIVLDDECSRIDELATLDGRVRGLAWDAARSRVLALDSGEMVALDGKDGHVVASAPLAEAYCVAISPDGKRIAAGAADTTVHVYDADMLRELVRLPGHSAYVHSVSWSPDGTWLASGSGDSTIRIWR